MGLVGFLRGFERYLMDIFFFTNIEAGIRLNGNVLELLSSKN